MDPVESTKVKVDEFVTLVTCHFIERGIKIDEGLALCATFVMHACVNNGISISQFKDFLQQLMNKYLQIEQEIEEYGDEF